MEVDLTTLVDRVAATVWEAQRTARPHSSVMTPWEHLDAMTKHKAREATLPFVRATVDAIRDGEL